MRSLGFPELLALLKVIVVIPTCLVFKKASYSLWWGILFLIPVVNVVGPWYLALADWPALRKGRATAG